LSGELLYYYFTTTLLLLYYCFTTTLLLLYYCVGSINTYVSGHLREPAAAAEEEEEEGVSVLEGAWERQVVAVVKQ
jgi:hypothetical protein